MCCWLKSLRSPAFEVYTSLYGKEKELLQPRAQFLEVLRGTILGVDLSKQLPPPRGSKEEPCIAPTYEVVDCMFREDALSTMKPV